MKNLRESLEKTVNEDCKPAIIKCIKAGINKSEKTTMEFHKFMEKPLLSHIDKIEEMYEKYKDDDFDHNEIAEEIAFDLQDEVTGKKWNSNVRKFRDPKIAEGILMYISDGYEDTFDSSLWDGEVDSETAELLQEWADDGFSISVDTFLSLEDEVYKIFINRAIYDMINTLKYGIEDFDN